MRRDLAVRILVDERLGVVADRVERLGHVLVALADGDAGDLAFRSTETGEAQGFRITADDEQAFTNAPEFSGALNLEYRTDLASGGNLSARVGYSYQDDVVATTEIVRTGALPITQDGYGLVNAGVIWNTGGSWSFSLQGTNLTDKEYRTTGYNLNAALGVVTGFYGPPRQYSLTAGVLEQLS